MYIEELHLDRVKCFENLHIDLRDESGGQRKWTVLLGENGVGKSTILQAIGLCLGGHGAAQELMAMRQDRSLVRASADVARIAATFCRTKADGKAQQGPASAELVAYDLRPNETFLTIPSQTAISWRSPTQRTLIEWSGADHGDFVCGYGPTRRLRADPSESRMERPLVARLVTLFDDGRRLLPAAGWMTAAHYASIAASTQDRKAQGRRRLEAMKGAIRALLPDVTEIVVGPEQVLLSTPLGEFPPEALSDGYRGMMGWIIDMLGHLSAAFPEAESLLECEGVVLIDEIDAHLHPMWQRHVISDLRGTFPNLQFIVTTHSPLTVQGARDGEVVVLKRKGSKVVAETDLASVEAWRADQVLTSGLFGLATTRSPQIEDKLRRRRELTEKRELSDAEQGELRTLGEELDVLLPPPGETPEQRRRQTEGEEIRRRLLSQVTPEELAEIRAKACTELTTRRAASTQNRGGVRD